MYIHYTVKELPWCLCSQSCPDFYFAKFRLLDFNDCFAKKDEPLKSHDGRLVDDLKGEAVSRNGKLLSRAASSRSSRWSPGSEVAPLR